MTRRLTRCLELLATYCVVAFVATVSANEATVYESISDIDIGPVFLTPAQRDELDELRMRPTAAPAASNNNGEAATPRPVVKEAAGYIISSSGGRHEWSGDDFVVARKSDHTTRRFPGDVAIQRHAPEDDSEGDSADETKDGEHGADKE